MIPRPQMIPKMDRKWSSTASDPQSRPQMIPKEKLEWLGLIVSISLLLQKVRLKAKFYFSNKYYTWTRETWIKTQWKNHSSVKMGSATHDFYLMPKCLFKWVFSLTGRLCSGRKRFAAYSILRGHDTHINFLQLLFLVGMICPLMQEHFLWPLLKCNGLHLNKGFRLFKCLLDPNNDKWFSFDGFLWYFVTR